MITFARAVCVRAKEEEISPMFDIHCHILPGLDDGAFSEDESLAMLALAAENGTHCLCCTPHTGPYSFDDLLSAYRRFRESARMHEIPVRLYLGQEIYLGEDFRRQIRNMEAGYPVSVNRSVYSLVEFHPQVRSADVFAAVQALTAIGCVPVIAHPERYVFAARDQENVLHLKKLGALLQINAGSLLGTFGRQAAHVADFLLYKRAADFIASDGHSPYARPPKLRDAHAIVSEYYSMEYADHLMRDNPRRMINNKKITPYT